MLHEIQHLFHPPVALRQWPEGDRISRLVMLVRDFDRETIENGWRSLSA